MRNLHKRKGTVSNNKQFFSVHECKIWLQSKLSAQVKYAFVQLALTTVDNWGWNCPWKHCSDSLWINCSWTIPPIHIKHKKACFQHTPQKFGLLSFPGKQEYSGQGKKQKDKTRKENKEVPLSSSHSDLCC